MQRKCPVPRCSKAIADRMFVCENHWRIIPARLRNRVIGAYHDYRVELISIQELRIVQAETLADYTGVDVDKIKLADVPVAGSRCHHCGRVILLADRQALEESDSGKLCVVGGRILPPDVAPATCARFAVHSCGAQREAA